MWLGIGGRRTSSRFGGGRGPSSNPRSLSEPLHFPARWAAGHGGTGYQGNRDKSSHLLFPSINLDDTNALAAAKEFYPVCGALRAALAPPRLAFGGRWASRCRAAASREHRRGCQNRQQPPRRMAIAASAIVTGLMKVTGRARSSPKSSRRSPAVGGWDTSENPADRESTPQLYGAR
jgi:hypothetical protein